MHSILHWLPVICTGLIIPVVLSKGIIVSFKKMHPAHVSEFAPLAIMKILLEKRKQMSNHFSEVVKLECCRAWCISGPEHGDPARAEGDGR